MPKVTGHRPSTSNAAPAKPEPVPAANGQQTQGQDREQRYGIKMSLYGRTKTGKTRLLSTFPKPLLILATEDGTKSIATHKTKVEKVSSNFLTGIKLERLYLSQTYLGIDFLRVYNSIQTAEAIQYALKDGYTTIGVDTIGGWSDLHLKDILGLEKVPAVKAYGMATRDQWGAISAETVKQMTDLYNLAELHGTNVVVLGHERNHTEKDDKDDTKLIASEIGIDVAKGVKKYLDKVSDYIVGTYVCEGVEEFWEEPEVEGGEKVKVERKTGNFEYRLRIARHSIYTLGFRSVMDNLPDSILNPTFDKILKVIMGEKP